VRILKKREVKKMERVKNGEVLVVESIGYRIGPTSAEAINCWVEGWGLGLKMDGMVHLYK